MLYYAYYYLYDYIIGGVGTNNDCLDNQVFQQNVYMYNSWVLLTVLATYIMQYEGITPKKVLLSEECESQWN